MLQRRLGLVNKGSSSNQSYPWWIMAVWILSWGTRIYNLGTEFSVYRVRNGVCQLTSLGLSFKLIVGLGKPTWRARSRDCLPSANNALCSLINLLLTSFWSCRRLSSYHQIGRPYSQTRPRLAHSLHWGVSISHFTFLNEQVQHPSKNSAKD